MIRRVWRAGVGCCIERSASLSADEANRMFHRVKIDLDAMHHRCLERDDASLTAIKHDEAGIILLTATRQPDPDHPTRTAPEFLVTIIPEGELFILDDYQFDDWDEVGIEHFHPAKVRWVPLDVGPPTISPAGRAPGKGAGRTLRSIFGKLRRLVKRDRHRESPD